MLAALEKSGRALETMQADFLETKLLALLDEQSEARGSVRLQVPGRFRWDYAEPQRSVMVVKDGRFARYFPRSKQVFRGPARGEADLLVGFGPGAAGLADKYEVTLVGEESVAGVPAHVLKLRPRGGGSGLFSEIQLWVEQARHVPVQTRLTEPTGDATTVRFENVVINGRLTGDAFDLRLPKDVVEVR